MVPARTTAIACLAAAVVAAVLVLLGRGELASADRDLLQRSFHAASSTRGLDGILVEVQRGGSRDAAIHAADSLARAARDPREARAIQEVVGCLRAQACPSGLERTVEAAKQSHSEELTRRWTEAEDRRLRARVETLVGVVLGAMATLIASITLLGVLPGLGGGTLRLSRISRISRLPDATLEDVFRRRLEELYALRMRAWENDRFAAYGEIAAGLSHGLKTPLASIRAATQVALAKLGSDHNAAGNLTDVLEEVDALVDQIQRFLKATGTGEPIPTRVHPRELIQAVERDYGSNAALRGVRIESKIDDDAAEIDVDPALVEMALRNLVENGLAVTPSGSPLGLSVRNTTAPERAGLDNTKPPDGKWVEIEVRDRGPGIPTDVMAGRVDTTKPGGSGLGIAISRRIAARHGGALFIDSSTGGTAVKMVLPASRPTLSEVPR